ACTRPRDVRPTTRGRPWLGLSTSDTTVRRCRRRQMQSTGPILIVDDEDDLRNLLRINLEREGFKAAVAATGAEALEVAQRVQPSLIVLDLMLPDTTGTEVCRRLRMMPELADVPII